MDLRIKYRSRSYNARNRYQKFVVETTPESCKIPEYNSLRDPNLSGFFATYDKRKLLRKQKLINKKGRVNDRVVFRTLVDESLLRKNRVKKSRSKTPPKNNSRKVKKKEFKLPPLRAKSHNASYDKSISNESYIDA
ncbi:unnamed protein product [Blepharisma stoltei]|uniref:Uncharacterized protein n=1 Tax=Blepharisma stoltei TaxID=1481888 RepID=A0AAU9IFQ3_9CILI|nr:unnamed protein product [Blepharisma stoltei]